MTIILSSCFHVHEAMLDFNNTQCTASVYVANGGPCVLRTKWNNHGREYNCAESVLLTMLLPLETPRAFLSVLFLFSDEGWLTRVQHLGL